MFSFFRAAEFDKQMLNNVEWEQEFAEQAQTQEQQNKELESTARELLSTVTDPKISSSEVPVGVCVRACVCMCMCMCV